MAYDAAPARPAGADQAPARRRRPAARLGRRRRAGSRAAASRWRRRSVAPCSTRRCRRTTRSSTARWTRRSSRRSSTTSPSATRRSQVAATLDALKETGFHWATRSGVTIAIEDVVTPEAKQADPRAPRGPGREGPEPVRARPDHRRRAPSGAHRDLDRGDQRGRRRDGGDLPEDQPDLHDGQLRCPRKHDAGPADRRHAWSGGQPEGRDHPAPDQDELPRGPVRARVLHLDPRCPQGSGRHRAADRRLRLPHPSAGRRLAGRHHPRGGLRHRARPAHADRAGRTRRACWSGSSNVETSVYSRNLAEDVVDGKETVGTAGGDLGDVLIDDAHRGRCRRGPGALAC